jgi:hypothetical protein
VSELSRRAENILEVASASGAKFHGTAMVLDRAGSLRMMNLDGWTLPGLAREFGAREIYTIRKWAATITVEGWSASDRCSISRISRSSPLLLPSLSSVF